MAYSTPPTKAVGDTLAAADWNTYVKDNMIDLSTRLLPTEYAAAGAEFTTNSTTYVDITDATADITVSRQSTIVMIVSANCKTLTAGQAAVFNGSIGGTADSTEVSTGLASYYIPLSYVYARTGVAAGTYTAKLQMRTTSSSDTAYVASLNMFVVGIPEA